MADANKKDGALATAGTIGFAVSGFAIGAIFNAGVNNNTTIFGGPDSETRWALFFVACLSGGFLGYTTFVVLKFLVQLMGKDK